MIIKGFTIERGSAHATHLMRVDQNEHVEVQELRGFVASDLHGAFKESQAIARGTKCRQHLFSCAFAPPNSANLSSAQFMAAIDKTEKALGLEGQPRAVVHHEKDGHLHVHCVWSRIDAATMKAKHLSHWKSKLGDVSRELHREFGIEMPRGLKDKDERSSLNFSQAESQTAKRIGVDPRALMEVAQDCWSKSDGLKSFRRALEGNAIQLARGDKRGFVLVDMSGQVMPVSRALGGKAKDVRAKLGSPDGLPSVKEATDTIRERLQGASRTRIDRSRARFAKHQSALKAENEALTKVHREQRAEIGKRQSADWNESTLERQARLPRGVIRKAWAWVSGELARIKALNEAEAKAQQARQQKEREQMAARQREQMAARQREDRRVLLEKLRALRSSQARELRSLRQEIAPYLREQRADARRRDGLASGLSLKLER